MNFHVNMKNRSLMYFWNFFQLIYWTIMHVMTTLCYLCDNSRDKSGVEQSWARYKQPEVFFIFSFIADVPNES